MSNCSLNSRIYHSFQLKIASSKYIKGNIWWIESINVMILVIQYHCASEITILVCRIFDGNQAERVNISSDQWH